MRIIKEFLTIITLCTTLTLQAIAIDVTSLHSIEYEYDKLNRVTKATYGSGESIAYSYDAGGNLLGVVFEGVNEVEKPNLAFYKDELWDNLIVIASDTPINNEHYITEQTYIGEKIVYATQFINQSNIQINNDSSTPLILALVYLDDSDNFIDIMPIAPNSYFQPHFRSWVSGSINHLVNTIGKHTLKIVLDPDSKINESNETDNILVKTFYVMSRDGDSDGDGIKDIDEGIADTDGDDIVNFLDTDSDGDGMSDKEEHQYGFDPLDSSDAYLDSDGDGVSNILEIRYGLDPTNSQDVLGDSDHDGMSDKDEIRFGRDPLTAQNTIFYQTIEGIWNHGYQNLELAHNEALISAKILENGKLIYLLSQNGKETKMSANIKRTILRVYNDDDSVATVYGSPSYTIDLNYDGTVMPHIDNAILPITAMPIGTKIELDEKKVRCTIPLSEKLEF